jgi:hypothetical protein
MDGTPAIFSHRVSDESEQVVIGSSNYMPLCRGCYIRELVDSADCVGLCPYNPILI